MWTRAELKTRAKAVLKGSYWQAFAASLLLLFTGGMDGGGPGFDFNMGSRDFREGGFGGYQPEWLSEILPIIIIVGLAVFLAVIALRLLIGYPLEVGGRRYFIDAADGRPDLNMLKRGFNRQWYWNIVKVMFIRGLKIFAWTLLLIIPGVVKGYAYRFVPYLLAENPEMSPARATALSDQLTAGHKMNMFVLDLSFLGWYFLGVLALGIGTLFVHPYVNSTMAELYAVLRQDALDRSYVTLEELTPSPGYMD